MQARIIIINCQVFDPVEFESVDGKYA